MKRSMNRTKGHGISDFLHGIIYSLPVCIYLFFFCFPQVTVCDKRSLNLNLTVQISDNVFLHCTRLNTWYAPSVHWSSLSITHTEYVVVPCLWRPLNVMTEERRNPLVHIMQLVLVLPQWKDSSHFFTYLILVILRWRKPVVPLLFVTLVDRFLFKKKTETVLSCVRSTRQWRCQKEAVEEEPSKVPSIRNAMPQLKRKYPRHGSKTLVEDLSERRSNQLNRESVLLDDLQMLYSQILHGYREPVEFSQIWSDMSSLLKIFSALWLPNRVTNMWTMHNISGT